MVKFVSIVLYALAVFVALGIGSAVESNQDRKVVGGLLLLGIVFAAAVALEVAA